jgi:hypothetical protein
VVTRAARDLSHGGRGLVNRVGDLPVGHVEDLTEHKHGSLGRAQRLQDGEHRHRDALGQLDVLGDIGAGQQRLGQPLADVLLAAARQGPHLVERLARDHADQVGPRVTHR